MTDHFLEPQRPKTLRRKIRLALVKFFGGRYRDIGCEYWYSGIFQRFLTISIYKIKRRALLTWYSIQIWYLKRRTRQ